ncbi:unnamed protein product, partial [Rotaria socialis]
ATIGSCVPFLDLLINNKNSILSTSVYRQLVAEPCVVPFISDHPPHVFSNIIHAALLRAVRYSSTSEIFQNERRAIRLMLLYNGYPSRYIDTHIRKFFVNSISQTSMIPFLDNESTPAMEIRLIVGHRNHRNTGHELVEKRPHPSLLKPIQLPNTKPPDETLELNPNASW